MMTVDKVLDQPLDKMRADFNSLESTAVINRYKKLEKPQQHILDVLAVFAVPFTLVEAKAICEGVAEFDLNQRPAHKLIKSSLRNVWIRAGLWREVGEMYEVHPALQGFIWTQRISGAELRALAQIIEEGFVLNDRESRSTSYQYLSVNEQQRIDRRLIVAVLLNDAKRFEQALLSVQDRRTPVELHFSIFWNNWLNRFGVAQLAECSQALNSLIILGYLGVYGRWLLHHESMLQWIVDFIQLHASERQKLCSLYLTQCLMLGRTTALDIVLPMADAKTVAIHQAWQLFIHNQPQQALVTLEHFLKVFTQQKQGTLYFEGVFGVFYTLMLIWRAFESFADPVDKKYWQKQLTFQVQEAVNRHKSDRDAYAMVQLYAVEIYRLYNGELKSQDANISLQIERWLAKNTAHTTWPLQFLLYCLAAYWLDQTLPAQWQGKLIDFFGQADVLGSPWLAMQLAHLIQLQIIQLQTPALVVQVACRKRIDALCEAAKQHNTLILASMLPVKARWQGALQALQQWTKDYTLQADSTDATRVVWMLGYDTQAHLSERRLQIKEQKRTKSGWSRGRALSLRSLVEDGGLDELSVKDRQVLKSALRQERVNYYRNEYALDFEAALLGLVGHPAVYYEKNPEQPIELVAKTPQLVLSEEGPQIRMAVVPHPRLLLEDDEHHVALVPETVQRFQVIQFNEEHWRLADIFGREGLLVPIEFKAQALQSLNAVTPFFNLQSEFDHGDDLVAETVNADARLHVWLTPQQQGLSLRVYVQPFAEQGPQFKPGLGASTVLTEINGRRIKTTRDLHAENQHWMQLINDAPVSMEFNDETSCDINGLEASYELLLYLQQQESWLQLHWPQGKALRLLPEASQQQLSLQVSSKQNWFELSGQLTVNENSVYSLQQLSTLLQNSGSGRFIKLDDDSVLVLTTTLKKKIDQWRAYTDQGRFHALASHVIEDIVDEVPLISDADWQQQLQRFMQAQTLEPAVPTTLQAQLRDYQQQGFQWLARLAHAGVGACLADDMGLGKTVQTLALLLMRAAQGPALIIAPKSVCTNWLQEAMRFAPTLKLNCFSQERATALQSLGAFDLVVCSYGLLQSNLADFMHIQWHTVVADEAQAIKNLQAKRTKAVLSLTADFRLALTGTPIENHLGDLWSLFHFINPGFLGSLEQFNRRFVTPMEQGHDRHLQTHLQSLIKPFLLRRLKRDVLTELPSRTEITIEVELSDKEQVLYEALRRQAVDNIASAKGTSGQKRVKMFAELMRLRRACCHPSMVMPEAGITSSKLEMLMTLVEELLANQHQALIFSQFVDHLQLIKTEFDRRQWRYQYLDGSTSAKHRQQAVTDFQAGQSDLFLISLKAGGVGLNLTAADYVIHMDPWWNPAVEDQASDRAHRMGQQRPVTIYRLVTTHTIEQKIMAMHGQKRDLATSLLTGTDSTAKLSLEDMQLLLER
jgi:superfamily II DNA or RNA helicase